MEFAVRSVGFSMFYPTALSGRSLRAGLVALVACGAWQAHAAVLPLSSDASPGGALRAGLLHEPPEEDMSGVSGQWVGRTSTGKLVSLILKMDDDARVGGATLDGVVADITNGPRPLVTPTVTGRTLAFAVRPTPCAKALARGVVTFVSEGLAHLDLQAGSTPLTVRLSKVS